jgi:hypothetical protein
MPNDRAVIVRPRQSDDHRRMDEFTTSGWFDPLIDPTLPPTIGARVDRS